MRRINKTSLMVLHCLTITLKDSAITETAAPCDRQQQRSLALISYYFLQYATIIPKLIRTYMCVPKMCEATAFFLNTGSVQMYAPMLFPAHQVVPKNALKNSRLQILVCNCNEVAEPTSRPIKTHTTSRNRFSNSSSSLLLTVNTIRNNAAA